MKERSTVDEYGAVARVIHWVSAAAVAALLVVGLTMTRVNGGDNTPLYRIHVGVGLALGVLTLARIVGRFVEPSPAPPAMPAWRRVVYDANHFALYLGALALVATGVSILIANELAPIPTEVVAADIDRGRAGRAHFLVAVVYAGLVAMHVIGVVTYQRTKGEVLARMGVRTPARRRDDANASARDSSDR